MDKECCSRSTSVAVLSPTDYCSYPAHRKRGVLHTIFYDTSKLKIGCELAETEDDKAGGVVLQLGLGLRGS